MKYRSLGNSGVKVSTLCLGTMTFGEADEKSMMHGISADEPTSFEIMDTALDAGINFFDSADVYGQDGLCERVVGKWFKQSGKRDHVVLATKMRFRMRPDVNGTGASRYRIRETVEASLRRLQTDRIDLYQIHMQDIDTPEEETLRALTDLVHQGKVLYIGASNYAAYRLAESRWISRVQNLEHFVTLQAQYSLLVRDLEREHVPLCADKGIGILPWSPLAGGFLSGKYRKGQEAPKGTRYDKWQERYAAFGSERNWRILDALEALSQELGASLSQVALAWLLHQRAVTSCIFGARSKQQLLDNLKASDLELSAAQLNKLDEACGFELGYPYAMIKNIQGRW
jgi:aryl-alcohol dehydrogenase-like predicted oxidoreductase